MLTVEVSSLYISNVWCPKTPLDGGMNSYLLPRKFWDTLIPTPLKMCLKYLNSGPKRAQTLAMKNHEDPLPFVTWLKNLVLELADHIWHKGRFCVGKERDGGDQGAAVEKYHILGEWNTSLIMSFGRSLKLCPHWIFNTQAKPWSLHWDSYIHIHI